MSSLLHMLVCASLLRIRAHGGFLSVAMLVPVNEDVLEACVDKVGH